MDHTPNILYEDNHLLVVDKPAMLATMGIAEGEESLVEILKRYLKRKYNKPGNVYLGVVSRLDSWVSGVIIFARTSKAAERLNRQFRDRTCSKTYMAIIPDVVGFPERGRLENCVGKNESLQRMVVVPSGKSKAEARLATLSYKTLSRNDNKRLVEIELETGRKHQIRVQFSAMGCPILGDRKYGSKLDFPRGIALHSFRLRLEHPTTKAPLDFEVTPPGYWKLTQFCIDPKTK